MTHSTPLPVVALIAGPTASGKSALALEIAQRHGGTIINADSAQLYRDLRILTARPSPDEEARVPHRLFGYVDGAHPYSAAAWADDAKAAVDEVLAQGRLPILVGGTGLYLRTLLEGIAPIPDIDPAIRRIVRALPVAQAHAALRREDPDAAARLRPSDTARVARALEVVRSTGRPMAAWQAARVGGIGGRIRLAPLLLLPDRQWLRERCEARFREMIRHGAVEEVRALLARPDLPPDAPVRRAIGVPEIAEWLAGRIGRAEAVERGSAATRQYAKRQYTWFRNQLLADWPRTNETENSFRLDHFERLLPN